MASAFLCEEAGVTLECVVCGSQFYHIPVGRGRYPRFCSGECRARRPSLQSAKYRHDGRYADRYADRYANKAETAFTCAICGKEGKTKQRTAKYCSRTCMAEGVSAALRKEKLKGRCVQCGNLFDPARLSAKQRAEGHVQRYCSVKCSADSKRVYATVQDERRAYAARKKARDGEKKPHDLICEECGAQFKSLAKSAKMCSDACRTARYEARLAKDRLPENQAVCQMCERMFVSVPGTGRRRKFCSAKCGERYSKLQYGSSHRKRARHFGVEIEPVNRLKVFIRDGWKCQICSKPAPRRLMGTCHDRAPELDHRIPMAMGGPHTYANVQLSCRRCNLDKGHTKIVGQMNLFPDVALGG